MSGHKPFSLSEDEKEILLKTARSVITAQVLGTSAEYMESTEKLDTVCGAFVTLHKEGRLRGCIGNIIGVHPLLVTIKRMAVASAFNDPRFPPLQAGELDQIDIEISVLSPLHEIESVDEIIVGTHGIYLEHPFGSGLLLPQVATEQGWDRDTFLEHTCFKAGLAGDSWRSPETRLSIFSATIFGEKTLFE